MPPEQTPPPREKATDKKAADEERTAPTGGEPVGGDEQPQKQQVAWAPEVAVLGRGRIDEATQKQKLQAARERMGDYERPGSLARVFDWALCQGKAV